MARPFYNVWTGPNYEKGKSREFAQILNRLRESNHTQDDIAKLKERLISKHCMNYPTDVPHLFIQNSKVDEFNNY